MKNVKIIFRNITTTTLSFLVLTCISQFTFGQTTVPGNTPPIFPAYLGWDDTGNTELDILQNNTLRQRYSSVNWTGINGAATNNASRLHIGLDGNFMNPFSLIHMGSDITTDIYRPWMNVGVTMIASEDILHLGLLERPVSSVADRQVDAVLAWGCQPNEGTAGPDNFRFLFIQPTTAFPPGPGTTQQGLETMRITPMGNVGIGDFSTMPTGLDEQPTQKLDVDGTARLRQMPNDTMDVIITGVRAEDPGMAGDYVLNYATLEDLGDQLCDWDVVNSGADVATGYTDGCVEGQVLVGVETQTGSNAKVFMTKDYAGTTLRVEANEDSGTSQTGGEFIAENAVTVNTGVRGTAIRSRFNRGLDGYAENAQTTNEGVRGRANDGRVNYGVLGSSLNATHLNYGVHGTARGGQEPFTPLNNVGVYGRAWDMASEVNFGGYFIACDAPSNIGVYAETCDPPDITQNIAIYSVGQVFETNMPLTLSDENVKTNLSEIDGAIGIIEQLNPLVYNYNTEQFPHLRLPSTLNYGFSAQEVQQVLPDMVNEVQHPAKYDTSGNVISPSEDLLGMQYTQLIAILTAGIKEQQAQLSEQDQTIDDLQQSLNNQNDLIAQMMDQMDALADQVNDCCDGGFKYNPVNEDHGNLNEKANPNGNILEQNVPNPFRSQTTISYTLEQGGKVLLNIFDKTGKPLTTLVEAEQQAGEYRCAWDASGLPVGLYHYALYVDGELLVKKAIKLQE